MSEIQLVSNKPTGFYAIPVNKSTFSFQPIESIKNILHENQENHNLAMIGNKASNETKRRVTVNGTGELKLPPDQVKLAIVITNSKSKIEDAKESVHRRYEYVYQTMRKYKINESNIIVNTSYNRKEDNTFEVRCELSSILNDFKVYLQIYNILIEKLDKTVKIQEPIFYHSSIRMEEIKRQTTIQAIRNAKRTANDIAASVNLSLGKPIEINQETYKETYADQLNLNLNNLNQKSLTDFINEKTLKVTCVVRVTFEMIKHKKREQIE